MLAHAPHFNVGAAGKLAHDLYALDARATPLTSERDQNFLLAMPDGTRAVLKIANALEDRAMLDAQQSAMTHLASSLDIVPRVLATRTGAMITDVADDDGRRHFVWAVSHLPGVPLATLRRRTPALLMDFGRRIGALSQGLSGFDHAAIHRHFYWDLARGREVIAEYRPLVDDAALGATIDALLARFEAHVAPLLPTLRRSAIHNDLNDNNVLVGGGDDLYSRNQQAVGLVDFGDMVYGYTVADLAIAAAYVCLDAADTCAMCYYEFADIALYAPRSADGWSAMSTVRQTLDAMLAGGPAYGTPNHFTRWYPFYAADSLPAMLIAAYDCMLEGGDKDWIPKNYPGLRKWTEEMLATDKDGNGLIEYGLSGNSGSWPAQFRYRPSNWWDCIGFGHEDAYANALAYRAPRNMAQIARHCGKNEDGARYTAAADKLKAAYFEAFYNPATGVLAGWRSADGQLHDYYFMFVTGIAIHYGLVPKDKANAIMDKMLAKMKEVGFTRFDLGLPGNLITVLRKDFAEAESGNLRLGCGTKEDCSDGFQIYENGGATACFAYFTIAALYDLGRKDEADAILFPMIDGIDKGESEGFGPNSVMSNDWRTWDGTARGAEGFLSDTYYVMLAVMAREHKLQERE